MGYITLNPQIETRVVFMIGNGFDLGLGLHTDYASFLKYYLRLVSDSPVVNKMKENIKKNISNWSDAEVAFGELPFSSYGDDIESVFCECLKDFQSQLECYLMDEEIRLKFNSKEHKLKVKNILITSIEDLLSAKRLRLYKSEREKYRIDFVNFNYTQTLDKILCVDDDKNVDFLNNEISIGEICHVHGHLRKELLFGVDDIAQIKDPLLNEISEDAGYLIKSDMADECKLDGYRRAKEIINKSNVVVLFGLSYGKTDARWWRLLLSRLKNAEEFNHNFRIVLCPFTLKPQDNFTAADLIYCKRREIGRFLKNVPPENCNGLKNLLNKRVAVLDHGPFVDPISKNAYYCDPLHLHTIGSICVDGYDGNPII